MVGCTGLSHRKLGIFNEMYQVWKELLRLKGYREYYYVAVNPITQHTAHKYSEIISEKHVAFEDFVNERTGDKPFLAFKFEGAAGKAGVLGVLAKL